MYSGMNSIILFEITPRGPRAFQTHNGSGIIFICHALKSLKKKKKLTQSGIKHVGGVALLFLLFSQPFDRKFFP